MTTQIPFVKEWIRDHILKGGPKSRSIQLLAVIVTYITLTFFMTPAHGASSVIGGSTTNVGRIIIISPNPGATQQANGKVLLDTLAGITAV